jgi:hypothetical protein
MRDRIGKGWRYAFWTAVIAVITHQFKTKLAHWRETRANRLKTQSGPGGNTMSNPVADVKLALTTMSQLHQALPVMAQGLLDLKQGWADKKDPAKLAADFDKWYSDNQPLINQLLTLAGIATTVAAAA